MNDLLEAVAAIGSDLDLTSTLKRIVQAAVDLSGARYGALSVLDEEGGIADFLTIGATAEEIVQIGHWPRGEGVLGLLIDDPRPMRLRELAAHPASSGFPPGHPVMHSFLGAPVRMGERILGNLYLTEKRAGVFTAEDEQAVVALGQAAGAAITNARLYSMARCQEAWAQARASVTQLLSDEVDLADAVARVSGPLLTLIPADSFHVTTAQEEHDHAGVTFAIPLGRYGVLLIERSAGEPEFSAKTRVEAQRFADHLLVSLDATAGRRDAERVRILEERDRIARDLHDTVIQQIFATGLSLQSTLRLIDEQPRATRRVHAAVDALDETIRQIRTTIFGLHTTERPAAPGFRTQITGLVERAASYLGFTPRLRLTGPLDSAVSPQIREHAVAVLLEALTNVVRHARAGQVEVTVQTAAGRLEVSVRDDGVGLPEGPRSGLRNLAGRAAELGGSFEAATRPQGGAEVVWRVPL